MMHTVIKMLRKHQPHLVQEYRRNTRADVENLNYGAINATFESPLRRKRIRLLAFNQFNQNHDKAVQSNSLFYWLLMMA